jgi:hypothetical protein
VNWNAGAKKRYEESRRADPRQTARFGSRQKPARRTIAITDGVATVTSLKKIAANRRNAARSTGPVTAQGKARASRNALRHGFSVPVYRASAVAADIGEIVLQLVGNAASRTELDLARAAAEAQLKLVRIRGEKQVLLEVLVSGVSSPDMQAIRRLDRYERRAKSKRKRALRELSQLCQLPIFR